MTHNNSAYQEHQLKRWMRSDAHRFVRPDWRRYVRPGFERDHPFALYERKFDPNQPRVPAGDPAGGQWTSDGSTSSARIVAIFSDDAPTPTMLAAIALGHHHIPRGVFKKFAFPRETQAVFNQATTGPLLDPTSNWFDKEHREYNDAVERLIRRYLASNHVDESEVAPDQAREILGQVFASEEPPIRNFRMRMQFREIRRFIMRRLRGFE